VGLTVKRTPFDQRTRTPLARGKGPKRGVGLATRTRIRARAAERGEAHEASAGARVPRLDSCGAVLHGGPRAARLRLHRPPPADRTGAHSHEGRGHPDLFDVCPMCPALHDATESGRRHAWEARFGLSLVALAHAYTLRWIAETGFDLDAYLAGLDANPKRAAYAAELRDAMRESAVGAHLNPKELAA
jgi:hypothetical protein